MLAVDTFRYTFSKTMHFRYALLLSALIAAPALAQPAGDCPYPIIFMHGFTGSQFSWEPFTNHPDVNAIWGPWTDTYHAVLNAYENEERIAGPDGILNTSDDDVLVTFTNETNTLAPGCIYAYNFENFWNENPADPQLDLNSGDSPGGIFASESDSNEEATYKQGYVVGRMIEAVLAANPGKDKVILVGHSMGGLAGREYLQRADESGTPMWWVDPASPDGHHVAKLLTVGTPHRGSNLFGNPFRYGDQPLDGIPDINSSATRDLRYNYFCPFCSSPGPYLFNGNEGNGFGWHTDDINIDGDENDFITGINIDGRDQGFDDPWDGTTENPAMPLPTNIRYTWLTSNGDQVVDLARQWIYEGSVPMPSDGVPYRMADTLLTDTFHLDQQEDTDAVIRGLDEPDYPYHAYSLALNKLYNGTATIRSFNVPDGAPADDPDWYAVETGGGWTRVLLRPAAGRGGRLDLYDAPPDPYSTDPSVIGVDFPAGERRVTLQAFLGAGPHYLRIRHDGIGASDWKQPYRFMIRGTPGAPLATAGVSAPGEIPNGISLGANYPNPFNPATVIPFTLEERGHVTLSIYDTMGRRIAVLVDRMLSAGSHSVRWDAANDAGFPVASGVYSIRLEGMGVADSRRIMLLK